MIRKITSHQPIYAFGEQVGSLQLVLTEGFSFYELEYKLDKKYRRQGIMSIYLPVYLAELKRNNINNLVANVKKNNYASKKLLRRNGFFKLKEFGKYESFLAVLNSKLEKRDLEALSQIIVNQFICTK